MNANAPTPIKPKIDLQAPSVLLMGTVGSGKTYSLSTLLKAGLEVFVIATEPTGLDSLIDVVMEQKLDINKLHYKAIQPARTGFDGLLSIAQKVSVMGFEQLAKLPPTSGRQDAQWINLLKTCSNFVDDRTGKEYGSIQDFGPDRAFIIDSLSGINLMAMDMVVGDKPNMHMGEWGIAMTLIEKLVLNLCSGLRCMFILTSHLEREVNEITGATQTMASTLGKKLAPKLPRFFSEVVMTYKQDNNFYWSTSTTGVDLKNRALPVSDKLPPSFAPIIDTYNKRLALAKG